MQQIGQNKKKYGDGKILRKEKLLEGYVFRDHIWSWKTFSGFFILMFTVTVINSTAYISDGCQEDKEQHKDNKFFLSHKYFTITIISRRLDLLFSYDQIFIICFTYFIYTLSCPQPLHSWETPVLYHFK